MAFLEKRQYKYFQIHPEGFVWKGTFFPFEQITQIYFSWVNTTQRLNFIKIGEAESAVLRITVKSGQRIVLEFDEAGFFHGWNHNKSKDIENLKEYCSYLARHSFPHRLSAYVDELTERGYFTYDRCQFYPGQRIVRGPKEFPIGSTSFFRGQGYVELRRKNCTLIERLKGKASLRFHTQTNADVIFHLLDKLFHVRWDA